MGSSLLVKSDIKEYGLENFKKEILFIFDNRDEMVKKEKEIVNREFVIREDTYNQKLGGDGFGPIGLKLTEEHKQKLSIKATGRRHTEETKCIIRAKRKLQIFSVETRAKFTARNNARKYTPHTQATKDAISIANKGKTKPPRSQSHCENISKAKTGKKTGPQTQQHKDNIKKGKQKKVYLHKLDVILGIISNIINCKQTNNE